MKVDTDKANSASVIKENMKILKQTWEEENFMKICSIQPRAVEQFFMLWEMAD